MEEHGKQPDYALAVIERRRFTVRHRTAGLAVLVILALAGGGCAPETKARLGIAWKDFKGNFRTEKPSISDHPLRYKASPEKNLDTITDKRLFVYKYYPELYDSIYKGTGPINQQSLVNWHAEGDRKYHHRHRFEYNQDIEHLYRDK